VAISANTKISTIVNHDKPAGESVSIFYSGCILFNLAEKTGRFRPKALSVPSKLSIGYYDR